MKDYNIILSGDSKTEKNVFSGDCRNYDIVLSGNSITMNRINKNDRYYDADVLQKEIKKFKLTELKSRSTLDHIYRENIKKEINENN